MNLPRPTEAELAVLRVLWQRGPSTVRQVWEQLSRSQTTGYTTVLKIMQIMAEKGLLQRDKARRSHVYHATRSEQQTQRQVLGHLLDKVFAGSASKLVLQALATRKASRQELEQIRKLLDDLEGGRQ